MDPIDPSLQSPDAFRSGGENAAPNALDRDATRFRLAVAAVACFAILLPIAVWWGLSALRGLNAPQASTSQTAAERPPSSLKPRGPRYPSAQSFISMETPEQLRDVGQRSEFGFRFHVKKPGRIVAIRFWRAVGDIEPHVGRIWKHDRTLLASVDFPRASIEGWQKVELVDPVPVDSDADYAVTVDASERCPATPFAIPKPIERGNLRVLRSAFANVKGGFPNQGDQHAYFRDVFVLFD